jgi:hypothetical protein
MMQYDGSVSACTAGASANRNTNEIKRQTTLRMIKILPPYGMAEGWKKEASCQSRFAKY